MSAAGIKTQSKKTVENLTSNGDLLEAVFNTSSLGLHVLKSIRDNNGKIVDFDIVLTNRTSDKIAGRKVMGLRMLEGWPHTKTIGLFDKFIAAVDQGLPVDYVQYYEADGVRAWFRWLATKFNDGLYVTIEDISEAKKNEEFLKRTANNLQSTFDGVPALIALLEPLEGSGHEPVDFLISSANQALANFTNLKIHEVVGKRFSSLYPEVFEGELMEQYRDVFTTGQQINTEYYYSSRKTWFAMSVTRQANGRGLVVAAIDVTEKKRAEEEQKQIEILTSLDKMKTDFFNNVSHEFRTPLTLLLGPLREVLAATSIPRTHLNKLEMVQRNALRLQKLVNSLLDFARIESGRFDTIFQPTDICEFTTMLAGNFRSAFEKAGLQFNVRCEENDIVYINRNMWEKIVFNLLSNALKYTLKGNVDLRIKSLKRTIQLHVSDSGVGISNENITKIFDRFVRIENQQARIYEGSGIGLALVKELVAMHGGVIKVKSKLGKGTEFIVSIPHGKKHLPSKNVHEFNDRDYASIYSDFFQLEALSWISPPSEHGKAGNEQTKPVVLLVDDNKDLRNYITGILRYRFNVVGAINGKKAIELIENGLYPDLILSDIMMPDMNGFEFLKTIKGNQSLAIIPFVFLSAKASEEERIRGIRAGADQYLIKPFSANELLAVVESRILVRSMELSDKNNTDSF